jgi:predicted O-methyltransferase YrrM
VNFPDRQRAAADLQMTDFDHEYARTYPTEKRKYSETYWGVLFGLACQAARIAEIGVDRGISTRAFLSALVNAGGGTLWSVDTVPEVEAPIRAQLDDGMWPHVTWHFIANHSTLVMPPGELDVLYVDGDHSPAAVEADMKLWAPHVRDGGLVIVDDVNLKFPGKLEWFRKRPALPFWRIGPMVWWRVTPTTRWQIEQVIP